MKAFVVRLAGRIAEKAKAGTLSKRAELMMQTVVDVKNNKRRGASQKQVRGAERGVRLLRVLVYVRPSAALNSSPE